MIGHWSRWVVLSLTILGSVPFVLLAQFSPIPETIPCTACPFPLIVDLDQDQDPDLLFVRSDSIRWVENLGGAIWAPATAVMANDIYFLNIALATDLDGDSDIDMVGTSPPLQPEGLVVLLRNTGSGFDVESIDEGLNTFRSIEQAVDLDNDGDLDLLGIPTEDGEVWYRNNGDGAYQRELIRKWCDEQVRGPYAPVDVEGDGDLDLACYAPHLGRLIVHWNLGDGVFGPFTSGSTFIASAIDYPNGIACNAADINGDGFTDLVLGGRAAISSGYGTFQLSNAQNPSRREYQSLANVDCDNALEAILSSGSVIDVDNFDLVSALGNVVPTGLASRTSVADLNGDGRIDLLTGPAVGTGTIAWYENVAVPPEVSLELPWDTLYNGDVVDLVGGLPTGGGGSYSGQGVFDGFLYTEDLSGYVVIEFDYATYNEGTNCIGTAMDSIYIVNTTGMDEGRVDPWTTYPNPVHEALYLEWTGDTPFSFEIFDMAGRSIHATTPVQVGRGAVITIPTLAFAEGTYRLQLVLPNGRSQAIPFLVAH